MATSSASNPIGFVQSLTGSATVNRDGVTKVLQIGDALHADDLIATGDVSSIVIDFESI